MHTYYTRHWNTEKLPATMNRSNEGEKSMDLYTHISQQKTSPLHLRAEAYQLASVTLGRNGQNT